MTDTLKLVVLGSGGVGKSALTIRFIQDVFLEEYDPTVKKYTKIHKYKYNSNIMHGQIEDAYRPCKMVDGKPYYFDILDTAGEQEFAALRDVWIRESQGFLIVYSITQRYTFEALGKYLNQLLRLKEDELDSVGVVLAGNKCDLSDRRQVSLEEGKSLVEAWKNKGFEKVQFYETSAKEKINSEDCFYQVARYLIQNHPKEESTNTQSSCCCIL